ncbi:hypothetical protein SNOG_15603 [Parastagonospora nodorum SN15]|uniref:Uncharacterized protein n=1 Tax=Phaeosphaeria nodorum (strain SN15 / ATCC MYA-4574 / FGSC 10173) TaxID=321614 RepID=Q0TXW8_PHANO|nr:hypothetical protein SNOG_15603 [Parastagonospora nodorum SN15]KAH3961360.1 hypothetical protein HBH51_184660 [Parastagonospora nodorum]EAT76978.1 hypothetical protein SNOG_15603 [Parastagonospora nodorum SN15]KAH4322200.1 hypothetical protein HBI00_202780 [Parastagonospora nodorum]KAH4358091.1 hypothetical protein HBH94_214940 [Parastagonospora nodorum]KAH4374072.1 hypothetical protein HBH99_223090 [Parastagonospora nodorum]
MTLDLQNQGTARATQDGAVRGRHEEAQVARSASLRRYDCRGPMSASRGTKDARSRQPATTTRGQRGSK